MVHKCINCGETMQPYYARDGSTMFVCPNVRITIKKEGMVPYGFNFCEMGVKSKTAADQIQRFIEMTPKLGKKEAEKIRREMDALPVEDDLIISDKLSPLLVNSKECIELHAKLESVKASFKNIAKTITLEQLRKATQNTVSDIKLMKFSNLAILLGLKEEQLPQLFSDAIKLGYAIDKTSEYAVESLSKGLARRSRKIIDNIGITFKAQEANNWYKQSQELDKLTESDKTVAWQQYAIKLITEKAEVLEIGEKQAKRDQLKARIQNMKAEYGKELA